MTGDEDTELGRGKLRTALVLIILVVAVFVATFIFR